MTHKEYQQHNNHRKPAKELHRHPEATDESRNRRAIAVAMLKTEQQQKIFFLREFGLTFDEIGTRLNISRQGAHKEYSKACACIDSFIKDRNNLVPQNPAKNEGDLYSVSIHTLNLSSRAIKGLKARNIYSVGKLIDERRSLENIPGVGKVTAKEYDEALLEYESRLGRNK